MEGIRQNPAQDRGAEGAVVRDGGDHQVSEFLTDTEAVAFLRMKKTPDQARRTMQHLRDTGQLRGARIGKQWLYTRDELRHYVATKEVIDRLIGRAEAAERRVRELEKRLESEAA